MAAAEEEQADEALESAVDSSNKIPSVLMSDPAFDSIRDVKLPAGFEGGDSDSDDAGAAMEGGNLYYSDPSKDPYMQAATGRDADSAAPGGAGWAGAGLEYDDPEDADDFVARGTDAFMVVASTEDDMSQLEVYVYNEEDGAFFVHHDISLPAFPLSLAWSDCAPVYSAPVEGASAAAVETDPAKAPVGSFVAVGTFKPGIELWSLDAVDPMEPAQVLGGLDKSASKPGKKGRGAAPQLKKGSHTDAVMGLSWNQTFRHLLASGSADSTVKLWDVLTGDVVHTFDHHKGKVQAVQWHPLEHSILASGSYDRSVVMLDARNPGGNKASMSVPSDVESLAWSPHSVPHLFVSTDSGHVHAFDVRNPSKGAIFTLKAHSGACTSISLAPRVKGLMATAGEDECVKLWDLAGAGGGPELVTSKTMDIGKVFTAGFYPHSPWLLAAGGSKGKVAIWDIDTDAPTAAKRFMTGASDVPGAQGRVLPVAAVPQLAVRPRDDAQAHESHALSGGANAGARNGQDFSQREVDAVLETQAAAAASGGAAAVVELTGVQKAEAAAAAIKAAAAAPDASKGKRGRRGGRKAKKASL